MTCRVCDLVYADPVDPSERGYFDIAAMGQHDAPLDLEHAVADFAELVTKVCAYFEHHRGRSPRARSSSVECTLRTHRCAVHGTTIDVIDPTEHADAALVTEALVETLGARLDHTDIVLLHEFLEGVHDPMQVLDGLAGRLDRDALVAVAFANMASAGSRLLRRRWRSFFDKKIAFYSAQNLERLLWRAGFTPLDNENLRTRYSLGYLAARFDLPVARTELLESSGLGTGECHDRHGSRGDSLRADRP